jgi:hypothetical protein
VEPVSTIIQVFEECLNLDVKCEVDGGRLG